MKKMRAVAYAAMITGLMSLAGLGCFVFYMLLPKTDVTTTSSSPKEEKESEPNKEEQAVEVPRNEPQTDEPTFTVRFRRPYYVPFLLAADEIKRSMPAYRKQLQEENELRKKLEAEDAATLEIQGISTESKPIITEPPVSRQQPVQPPVQRPVPQPEIKKTAQEPVAKKQEKLPPPAKVVELPVQKPEPDPAGKRVVTVRQARERGDVAERVLSDRELVNVFHNIIDEKNDKDSDASCVHIQSLPESEKVANQISYYLSSKGFSMAGRGEAPTTARGIRVSAKSQCITIVVGRM